MVFLSVIIPICNAERYLEECLQSLLTSLPEAPNAEIILVDDGSDDESGTLCDHFAARHPGLFRAVHQANRGVAAARNTGLLLARGTYIAWVDPDDTVAPEWYTEIRAALVPYRPDLLVMDTLRFGPGGSTSEIYGRPEGAVAPDRFRKDLYRDIRMLSGLPNKVFHRTVLEGVRFDEKLPILEDYAAMPQILRKVRSVRYLPRLLYRYRQHDDSLLHRRGQAMAWQSFQIALRRLDSLPRKYRRAARTGTAIQALRCCQSPGAAPRQIHFCIRYLQRVLPGILADPQVPVKWKLKFLLLLYKSQFHKR